MAERRMFAKSIIDSDMFLDMPLTAQCLYFHLGMRADDDGFVNNPNKIKRMLGASNDDMKLLIAKRFIFHFETGIIVIRHWKICNKVRKDMYKKTECTYEKSMLIEMENGVYEMSSQTCNGPVTESVQVCNVPGTQVRLGQDRSGQARLGEGSTAQSAESGDRSHSSKMQVIVDEWNTLQAYGIKNIVKLTAGTKRYDSLTARISQYSEQAVLDAIDKIRQSDFLQGRNKNGWMITFDWFILPNNFPKVLEGVYDNRKPDTDTPSGYTDQVTKQINEVDTWI